MGSRSPDAPIDRVPLPESDLTLSVIAERIAHERELRQMAADYDRQIRATSDRHEQETRELVQRLEDDARRKESARIEERLTVLNHERQRQEQDRSSFATRGETDIALAALGEKSYTAIKDLSTAITTLKEQRERDLGRQSGTQGIQSWLAPNLSSVIAVGATIVTLYLLLTRQ